MHLLIVGGCFPVQHNIVPDQLYHAQLRRALAAGAGGTLPGLSLVRYERLSTCLSKVSAALARSSEPPVLLFHLRAEPVMRLSKLYYRYLDPRGRVRHSLNWPGADLGNAERYNWLAYADRARPAAEPSSDLYTPIVEPARQRQLRQLNLRLGRWLGYERRAQRHYAALISSVAEACRAAGGRLVLIGPVSRPAGVEENRLSDRLDTYFRAFAARHALAYVPALGLTDAAGQPLFFPNGIHVSAAGHTRMAERLYSYLRP